MAEELRADDVLGDNFNRLDSRGGSANKLPNTEATYTVEVHKGAIFKSINPQTKGHPIFTLDFTVLKSSTDQVTVGTKKSWTQNLTQSFGDKEYGKENVKQCVAAIFGLEPGTPDANALGNDAVQKVLDGECEGLTVVVETVPKESKAGRPWTLHIWSPDQEIAEG